MNCFQRAESAKRNVVTENVEREKEDVNRNDAVMRLPGRLYSSESLLNFHIELIYIMFQK